MHVAKLTNPLLVENVDYQKSKLRILLIERREVFVMASIQERLQIKREPLDKWSIREQLCLASAVAKSGDQNWMSVSRALKPFGEPNRPADWFHQKNCASQYGSLLENVDTPKRKKRASGSETVIETPIETILRKLTKDRILELQTFLQEEKTEYLKLQEEMILLQSGNVSEELLDKWCKEIDDEEKLKEEEALAHAQWLQEREIRKQEIERAWRPLGKPSLSLAQKRKVPEKLDTLMDIDNEENQHGQQLETGKPALSPLLTSLLKSPSQAQNVTSSSILHTVITSQRHNTTPNSCNTTIANLLNTSPSVNQNCDFPSPNVSLNQDQTNYILTSGSLTRDLLEEAVDALPNIKVEDLESSILSSDEPLPEMKNEEVEVIISDLIQNAEVVSNPEQHLQLDENEDIITNLDNELQELCNEEEAAAAKEAALAKNQMDKTDTVTPKRDPFEFEEDPEICQLTKHTSISKLYQENEKQEDIGEKNSFDLHIKEEEIKQDKGVSQNSGSVEIVEVVVLDEEEIDKQLNKTQIQDIVHSFTSEVDKVANKIEQDSDEISLEVKIEKTNNPVYEESSLEVDSKSSDADSKNTIDEANKIPLEESFNDNEFTGSFFDDLNMEVNKLDKTGKAKRDYSRTKKRESEKDFDILLAVEKAVNAQLENTNDLNEDSSLEKRECHEIDKKLDTGIKSKIKGDTDGSCSPWNDDEELSGIRSKRRYSTPATPSDSIPNSPASSSAYFEDDRDYKNWKKSVIFENVCFLKIKLAHCEVYRTENKAYSHGDKLKMFLAVMLDSNTSENKYALLLFLKFAMVFENPSEDKDFQ
ncbi:hypothetical protein RN001_001959 [Aquatica leii]|uniref:Bromodomain-containing protein 8 n=1 Tax=Aquatica leii TaxID=1421715 RepID=A0AAN7SR29_9COLE|nr:hypothetical protein RN001_001959 [Aquatica leii]